MFIDEEKQAHRFGWLRSPVTLALAALAFCVVTMFATIGGTLTATAASVPRPSTPVLHHAASYLPAGYQHLAFAMLAGGFIVMAGGCFVLSRRSFRDTLKAENRRSDHR